MLVALISDVHGNLVALDTVLSDLERERPDGTVCLGDVAATGPQPREAVERLRALGCPVVMGNADEELFRPLRSVPPRAASKDGRRVWEIDRWCTARLSPENLEYLRGFRPTVDLSLGHGRMLLCFHGSPRSFDDVIEATTPDGELDRMLSGHEATVMAGGHTHVQFVRRRRETTMLNPGSADLNPPGAEYALVASERDRLRIDLRCLVLPNDEIRRTALESGMPHAEWWASFWR